MLSRSLRVSKAAAADEMEDEGALQGKVHDAYAAAARGWAMHGEQQRDTVQESEFGPRFKSSVGRTGGAYARTKNGHGGGGAVRRGAVCCGVFEPARAQEDIASFLVFAGVVH